jgi:hypothetical protein
MVDLNIVRFRLDHFYPRRGTPVYHPPIKISFSPKQVSNFLFSPLPAFHFLIRAWSVGTSIGLKLVTMLPRRDRMVFWDSCSTTYHHLSSIVWLPPGELRDERDLLPTLMAIALFPYKARDLANP